MDRKSFYYKEKVTKDEVNAAYDYVEQADWNARVDDNTYGVIAGLVASLGSAPNVAVTKGVAIDQLGHRIKAFTDGASSKTQSYATATDGTVTSVTGGNERWISVYANFGRQTLDPRTDGNGATVYFDQPVCLHDGTVGVSAGLGGSGVDKFLIVAGASAATGTAVKPSLLTTAVLLCDIKRTPSDASNVLDTSRRELFSIPDTAAVGTGNGLGVLMSAMSTWLGGRTNPAQTSLHAAIDKIITDLAATTVSDDGAERVGAAAGAAALASGSVRSQVDSLDTRTHMTGNVNWLGGRVFTASDLIQTIVATLIGDLGATTSSDDGAKRLGAQTSGNLPSGSVRSQLDHLDSAKGEVANATTWSATQTFTEASATTAPIIFGGTVADDDYRLLWQTELNAAADPTAQRVVRIYSKKTSESVRKVSFVLTYNAAWSGGSGGHWSSDVSVSSSPAIKVAIGKEGSTVSGIMGLRISFKDNTTSTWTDTGWDTFFGIDNGFGNAGNRSPDLIFGNQAGIAKEARVYILNDVPKILLSDGVTVKTFTIT